MDRNVGDAGAILADTSTSAAALGFIPVAAHFNLFPLLVKIGPTATAAALTEASDAERSDEEKQNSPLCERLTDDTMHAMAGLGLVDMIDEYTFGVNAVTEQINDVPSAIHGMMHFTTESLFAAAFLMRQLRDTKFQYPFTENNAPFQYGYKLLGEDQFVDKNMYEIMYMQGRLPSFNNFMEGKFGPFGTMPDRIRGFGYDLDTVVKNATTDVVCVDVGGGRGEMLLELKRAYPHLEKQHLVLQEYKPDMLNADELTIMTWDFKRETAQPVRGALLYSLTHIYHNLPDLDALQLMQKVAGAMTPDSRMLIHEMSRNKMYGKMNSTMVAHFGGRVRSSREWHQMASLCGLKVTFEEHPIIGEGLVEMMKVSSESVG